MEITELVEKNTSLLRLGLHLEFNDARHRIANHLQRNIDRSEYQFSIPFFLSPSIKRFYKKKEKETKQKQIEENIEILFKAFGVLLS